MASTQRGLVTLGDSDITDVTISAVDMSKAFIKVSGTYPTSSNMALFRKAYLTSGTNLRIEKNITSSGVFAYMAWQVIEDK